MPESKGRPQKKPTSPADRVRKPAGPNPTWWAPVFITLLLLGLVWIVVFYVSAGAYPVAAFGYWNLVMGFALLLLGFGMTMRWR